MNKIFLAASFLPIFIAGCASGSLQEKFQLSQPAAEAAAVAPVTIVNEAASPTLTATAAIIETEIPPIIPTLIPTIVPTNTMTAVPAPVKIGPDEFPPGVSPLSGLQVKNPQALSYPPIMVSVSNFPPSARPPAGLDWSPLVMEAYIGDGETRFLATFYGDYPIIGSSVAPSAYHDPKSPIALARVPFSNTINPLKPLLISDGVPLAQQTMVPPAQILLLKDTREVNGPGAGPIRSARVWYSEAASLNHATLAFCHAWEGVLKQLTGDFITVNPLDDNDINSAFIDVTRLEAYAQNSAFQLQPGDLSGNVFDNTPPGGTLAQIPGENAVVPASYKPNPAPVQAQEGKPANTIWVPWSNLSQIIWRYNPESGAYNRYQDQADAVTFVQSIDRLNGAPLTYENLIILFANHMKVANYVYEIELMYIQKYPALLFRDGKMYELFWTTASGDYELKTGRARPIRYIDAAGNPFPLKPGQTWVTIMPTGTNFQVHEVPPFDFTAKQAVRNLTVNYGKSADGELNTATFQEKIFYATDMDSRYPRRFSLIAEGSGTWAVPFSEGLVQTP